MPSRVDEAPRRTFLQLAMAAPLLGAAAASTDALPPDLAAAVGDYARATLASDKATLARLAAEDFLVVNSDSTVQDKLSYLADFDTPGFRVERYVVEEPVHRVWGGGALTGGALQLAWVQGGERHSRRVRVAHVWVRRRGRWEIAYTQLTRIPE